MRRRTSPHATGFTLIELLIVMGIIAVLIALVIIAINPLKQLIMGYDGQRAMESNQTQKAITQYLIDKWDLPQKAKLKEGEANAIEICGPAASSSDPNCAKLSDDLVAAFLGKMPVDPAAPCPAVRTGYAVFLQNGFIQVKSMYKGKAPGQVSMTCPPGAPVNLITALDTVGGTVGRETAIGIGAGGLPIVTYHNNVTADLKVAACSNAGCTLASVYTTVGASSLLRITAMAIGTDGFPVIAFRAINPYPPDATSVATLKVVKCANAYCSGGISMKTVDTAPGTGGYPGILVPADGLPFIAYQHASTPNSDLRVAKCGTANCSTVSSVTTADAGDDVGYQTAIALGTDGFPVIAHVDKTTSSIRVVKCSNASCSSRTINTVRTVPNPDFRFDIAVGTDGNPVIALFNTATQRLELVRCGDPGCSAAAVANVTAVGSVAGDVSVAIGADGFPAISFKDTVNLDLKFAKCADRGCLLPAVVVTLDAAGDVGSFNSLAIGADRLPIMSYQDVTNGGVKVIHCGNASCNP